LIEENTKLNLNTFGFQLSLLLNKGIETFAKIARNGGFCYAGNITKQKRGCVYFD
jgi:hypothetical protein